MRRCPSLGWGLDVFFLHVVLDELLELTNLLQTGAPQQLAETEAAERVLVGVLQAIQVPEEHPSSDA